MDDVCVSASDLRVHFKDLANAVAAGRQRVLVSRHGYPMVALVSQEDLAFLREHRPRMAAPESKESAMPETLEDPELMPLEEVERLYALTKGATGMRVDVWRGKAWLTMKLRTGKSPDEPPWPVPGYRAEGSAEEVAQGP